LLYCPAVANNGANLAYGCGDSEGDL
jgi:hypothetical protein